MAGGIALLAGLAALAPPGADLAARLHLKDARLLHPEHALRFVRGLGWALALGGGALLSLAMLARPEISGTSAPAPAGEAAAAPRPAGLARSGRGLTRIARRLARQEIAVLAASAAIGFLLGTPYALLRPVAFLSALAYNAQTRFEYKGLTGEATSFLPYVSLLGDAVTLPVLAAAAVGLVLAVRAPRRKALVLAALALLGPYLLVAASGHRAMRFLAPAWPAAAWLAAAALVAARNPRARRLVALAVVGRLAVAAVLMVRLFFVDSRILAARYLEEKVPPGGTIDLIANHAGYAPSPPPGRTLRIVPTLSREMAPVERFREAALRYPAEASPWLVLTASFYERFLDHPDQQPERARFFSDLIEGRGGFDVRARFRQEGLWEQPNEFLDPEIVVLERR
jgi:hypothetical protein